MEAPWKKESTGLGDRLAKAEGGPQKWQAGVGAWRGPGNIGDLGKASSLKQRDILQSSEATRVLAVVLGWENSVHLEQKGSSGVEEETAGEWVMGPPAPLLGNYDPAPVTSASSSSKWEQYLPSPLLEMWGSSKVMYMTMLCAQEGLCTLQAVLLLLLPAW